MKKTFQTFVLTAIGALIVSTSLIAQTPQFDPLPFEVSIDGQKAINKEGLSNVAIVTDPVPAKAKIKLTDVSGQIIINAFPSDDQGNPKEGSDATVIMFKNGKGKLSDKMSGDKLKSGHYLLNIMAGGKTARVLIQVK